jgi:uncharacterized protein
METNISNSVESIIVPDSLIWDEVLGRRFVINTRGRSGFVVLEGMALEVMRAALRGGHTVKTLAEAIPWSQENHAAFNQVLKRLADLELLWPGEAARKKVFQEIASRHRSVYDLWLQTTDQCNLDCGYCFVPKRPRSMSEAAIKEVITRLCADCAKAGFDELRIKFAGGEPTLVWPMIARVIEWSRASSTHLECDLSFAILTNGTLINSQMINLAKEGVLDISVSMDGIGRAQDLQRPFKDGSGSFETVSANVEKLSNEGVRAGILSVVGHQNVNDLIPIVEYAFELGHFIRLGLCREDDSTSNHLRTTESELCNGFEVLFDWMATALPKPSLYQCFRFGEVNFRTPKLRGCGAGQSGAAVNVDGTFAYCPSLMSINAGLLKGENAVKYLNENASSVFTDANVTNTPGCNTCEWRYICGNGCPMQGKANNGNSPKPSEHCELFRFALPRLGRLHAMQAILAE